MRQPPLLSFLAAKRLSYNLIVIFENHVSRPIRRNFRYLISIVLENDDQRAHLCDVLKSC